MSMTNGGTNLAAAWNTGLTNAYGTGTVIFPSPLPAPPMNTYTEQPKFCRNCGSPLLIFRARYTYNISNGTPDKSIKHLACGKILSFVRLPIVTNVVLHWMKNHVYEYDGLILLGHTIVTISGPFKDTDV